MKIQVKEKQTYGGDDADNFKAGTNCALRFQLLHNSVDVGIVELSHTKILWRRVEELKIYRVVA